MSYREVNTSRESTEASTPPEPVWHAARLMDNLVITPCEPIPMRLSNVRVQWELSSYAEGNERKKRNSNRSGASSTHVSRSGA